MELIKGWKEKKLRFFWNKGKIGYLYLENDYVLRGKIIFRYIEKESSDNY